MVRLWWQELNGILFWGIIRVLNFVFMVVCVYLIQEVCLWCHLAALEGFGAFVVREYLAMGSQGMEFLASI